MKPMSRATLIEAGRCCGNKCLNCPYMPRHVRGVTNRQNDMEYKKYQRISIAEMRPVTTEEITNFRAWGYMKTEDGVVVSISDADKRNGSPKPGDMIARNPEDHIDKWLVSAKYFEKNFKPLWD